MNGDQNQALNYKNKGNDHFKNKEYSKAIEAYTKAIGLNSMDATYYGNRAACYFAMRDYEKCIRDCDDALEVDPKFAKAYLRKGRSLYYLAKFDEAKTCLQKARELDSSDKSLNQEISGISQTVTAYNSAESHFSSGDLKHALDDYKRALMLCPELVPARIKSIECLAKTGDTKAAVDLANMYSPDLSTNVNFLYVKGLALTYHGQTEAGKRVWVEAMRLDPENVKCKTAIKNVNRQEEAKEKGNSAFKSGDQQGAINHYTTGINIDPQNKSLAATLYANRAAAYMKLKKFEDALSDCNHAIDLNDGYAKAYLRRGEVRMELGDYDDATRDFNRTHLLDPMLGARERIRVANQEAKKASKKDYYKVLGVEKSATEDDIKKAYRKLALKWHPDKNSQTPEKKAEAEKRFKEISEAYAVLSNPDKKRQFDLGSDPNDPTGGAGNFSGNFGGGFDGGFDAGDIDPNMIFKTFFGGQDPFAAFSGFGGGGMGGMGGMFGQQGGRGGNRGGGFPGFSGFSGFPAQDGNQKFSFQFKRN